MDLHARRGASVSPPPTMLCHGERPLLRDLERPHGDLPLDEHARIVQIGDGGARNEHRAEESQPRGRVPLEEQIVDRWLAGQTKGRITGPEALGDPPGEGSVLVVLGVGGHGLRW